MTLSRNRIIFIIGFILLLIVGYFGGWWDALFIKYPLSQTSKSAVPGVKMTKTRLTGWDNEKKKWDVSAQRIWQSTDGNFIHFRNINQGVAYSVEGKDIEFKAGWARWERIPEILYLGGGIEARFEDTVILTEDGTLNYRTEEMNCPHEVKMTRKDSRVTGKTLKVKFPKDEMLLQGNVILIQNKDQVTADGIMYNLKDESYQLINPKGVTIYP